MSMTLGFKINADLAEIRNGLKQVRKDFNSLIADVKAMKIDVKIDRPKLQTEIASAKALIHTGLGGAAAQTVKVKVKVNAATIAADMAAIRPQIAAALGAAGGNVRVRVDLPKLQADLAHARAMIAAMIASVGALPAGAININVNMGTIEATLKSLEKVIKQLKSEIGLLRGSLGGLGSSSTATASQVDALERQVRELQAQMARTRTEANQGSAAFSGMASQVRGLIASIGGLLGIRMFMQITDEAKQFRGQLALVTDTQEQLIDVQRKLTQSANFTGTELGGSISLYSKLKLSTSELNGASDDMLIRMSDITNKFVALGGAPTATANAAIFQFSQALGKGKLNGDEFVSIMEGALPLAAAMAKGMGMTIGEFTKASHEQKITTELMINSLLKMGATADEQFDKMPRTSAQAMTAIKRDFNDAVAEFDRGFGISAGVIGSMESLRENLSEVLAYLSAIGLSTGIALLGVGIAKVIFATYAKIAALIADRNATIAATKENLRAAQVALVQAQNELRVAEAQKLAAVTAAELAAAEMALIRARLGLTTTTRAYTAAQDAATAATSRAAMAGRGLLAVLGGPVGLLLTIGLLAAGFLSMRDNADSAIDTLNKMGTTAEEVAKKLRSMSFAQKEGIRLTVEQELRSKTTELNSLVSAFDEEMTYIQPKSKQGESQLDVLIKQRQSGAISVDEAYQQMKASGVLDGIEANRIRRLVRHAEAASNLADEIRSLVGQFDNLKAAESIVAATANNPIAQVSAKPKPDAPNDQLLLAKADFENQMRLLDAKKSAEQIGLAQYYAQKRSILESLHNIEIRMLQRKLSQETDPTKRGEVNTSIVEAKKVHANAMQLLGIEQTKEMAGAALATDKRRQQWQQEYDERNQKLLDIERTEAGIAERQHQGRLDRITKDAELSQQQKDQEANLSEAQYNADIQLIRKKRAEEMQGLTAQLQALRGNDLQSALDEIDAKWAETLERMRREGDDSGVQIVTEIVLRQRAEVKAADIQKQAQTELDNLANAEGMLERDAKSSGRGTLTLERDKEQARIVAIENLKVKLRELQDLEANGAANLSAPITDLENKIADLQLKVPALQDQMGMFYANLAETSISAGESGLSTFFMDLVEGSKSASDAIKDFAKNFIKSLAQMAAQALAKIAIFALLNALTGGFGGSIGKAGKNAKKGDGIGGFVAGLFHGGGIAGGAGAKKSYDMSVFTTAPRYHIGGIAGMKPGEVPAVLQAGEEVLTRNDPRHVANGGGGGGSTRIVNVIDPNMVQDYMQSSSGERVILNMIERNAGSVRQLLK